MDPGSKPIEGTGEFNLIRRLRGILNTCASPELYVDIGDDAAAYRTRDGYLQVVTTDALIEGHHFDLGFYSMEDVGYKAMAVNVSDIAAMNAQPRFATVALAVPGDLLVNQVESLYQGLRVGAEGHGVQIVGGDTTRSPVIMLSVTVIGEVTQQDLVRRSGGKPGDLLCITGTVGAAALGLHMLRHEAKPATSPFNVPEEARRHLAERHLRPAPRTDIIEDWKVRGVRPSAMIDISDGLAADVHQLCAASRCGAVIRRDALPVAIETRRAAEILGADPLKYALEGGDDYELLFAASADVCRGMDPAGYTVIGNLTAVRDSVHLEDSSGNVTHLPPAGHDHFSTQK